MKIKSTQLVWILFFIITLAALTVIAYFYIEPREIKLNEHQAVTIGNRISMNEHVRDSINQVVWHDELAHSSLGFGRFIWYSQRNSQRNNESQVSFNGLLKHIAETQTLPNWLINEKLPPWTSKKDFELTQHQGFKTKLSNFLLNHVGEQTQYLAINLELTLPKMLASMKNPFAKMHVYENFYHMVMQENGVYAMLDYVLFVGDGLSQKGSINKHGWGLLQVLENIHGNPNNITDEFIDRAAFLLDRRKLKNPNIERNEPQQWRKRLQTYRNSVP